MDVLLVFFYSKVYFFVVGDVVYRECSIVFVKDVGVFIMLVFFLGVISIVCIVI